MANGFDDLKFNEEQFENRNVQSMPDHPSDAGWSSDDVKRGFDETPQYLVSMERLNALFDRLGDVNAGTYIGAVAQDGSASTLQNELNKAFHRFITAGAGDMPRDIYDKNMNGIVDNAEKVGGKSLDEIYSSIWPVGSIYMSVVNVNPGSIFGGKWELFKPGRTLVCVDAGDGDFNAPEKLGGSKAMQVHSHGGSTSSADSSHTHGITIDQTWHEHHHSMGHTHSGGSAAWGGAHTHNLGQSYYHAFTPGARAYGHPIDNPSWYFQNAAHVVYEMGSEHTHSITHAPYSGNTAAAATPHTHNATIHGDNKSHTHTFTTGNAGSGQSQNLQPFVTCYMWVRRS